MAIDFTNATGSLFSILGRCGKLVDELKTYQTNQESNIILTSTLGLMGQLDNEPDIQGQAGTGYIGQLNSPAAVGSYAGNIASSVVNRIVFNDSPQLNQTLQSGNILASLREIIRQMKVQGATVLAHTVTATPTIFTGVGNGVVVAGIKRPQDGLDQELVYAEDLTVKVNTDSFTGGATAGNESLRITGKGKQGNRFAFNWPLGSNASAGVSAIDGSADNSSGNLLTNSGFDTFTTTNAPDNWTIVAGTAGTDIFEEVSITYDGAKALRLLGDGSTKIEMTQTFNVSTGTTGTVDEVTQYSLNLWMRRDGSAAGAGVLEIALVDQNGTILQDEKGTNNSTTIDLTALSTVYTAYNTMFRTDKALPTTVKLRLKLTTALTSGRSVYLDKMSFGTATRAYLSGPYIAVHSGAIPFQTDDQATVAITNSRGSGGSLSTFQSLMQRFFSEMETNELLLNSSSVPSISDTLITN